MTRHTTWTAKGIRLITSDLNCKCQHAVLKHLQSGYVNITSSRNKYIIFHLWIELVASLESQLVQGSTKLTTKQKEPHIAKPTVCPNGPGLVSLLGPASHSCTPCRSSGRWHVQFTHPLLSFTVQEASLFGHVLQRNLVLHEFVLFLFLHHGLLQHKFQHGI